MQQSKTLRELEEELEALREAAIRQNLAHDEEMRQLRMRCERNYKIAGAVCHFLMWAVTMGAATDPYNQLLGRSFEREAIMVGVFTSSSEFFVHENGYPYSNANNV